MAIGPDRRRASGAGIDEGLLYGLTRIGQALLPEG